MSQFFGPEPGVGPLISMVMDKTPHLLIVDDHREIRDLVSRFMIKHEFRVTTACDGKPFNPRELLARIKAVMRRTQSLPGEDREMGYVVAKFEGWLFDIRKRHLKSNDGIVIPLSSGEFNLLSTFVQYPQRVLTRDQLLDFTRSRSAESFDRAIDTQVSRLRRKVEADPKNPDLIKTEWGGGYVFTPEVVYE